MYRDRILFSTRSLDGIVWFCAPHHTKRSFLALVVLRCLCKNSHCNLEAEGTYSIYVVDVVSEGEVLKVEHDSRKRHIN